MRSIALVATAMALVCLQLCTVPLLARPTRSLAHPAVGRLVAARPSQRAARGRTAHARLGAPSTRKRTATTATGDRLRDSRNAAGPSRYGSATAQRSQADPHIADSYARHVASRDRPNSSSVARRQRSLAARAAIDAADNGVRAAQTTRGSRIKGLPASLAPPATPSALAQLHTVDAQHLSGDGTAADDERDPGTATTLASVGSTLPPATEARPLPSIAEEAAAPVLLPALRVSALYDSRGHLILPPPLYGSHEILLHQNRMADRDGLARVRDDADLLDLRHLHQLVPLPAGEALRVDDRLPQDRRYARPWTAVFLAVLARDFYANFHQPLQVNSAVRTVDFQQRLEHSNANAAPSFGDTASPHLTGQAVDIAKHGLSITQIAWMRTYLQPLIGQGKIDVEEEFQQACFHISVYRSYAPETPSRVTLAAAR